MAESQHFAEAVGAEAELHKIKTKIPQVMVVTDIPSLSLNLIQLIMAKAVAEIYNRSASGLNN